MFDQSLSQIFPIWFDMLSEAGRLQQRRTGQMLLRNGLRKCISIYYLEKLRKAFTGPKTLLIDSTFVLAAGKHHQTFPNVSVHQIMDNVAQVEHKNKNGKLC